MAAHRDPDDIPIDPEADEEDDPQPPLVRAGWVDPDAARPARLADEAGPAVAPDDPPPARRDTP